MKKIYETPKMKYELIAQKDVITASTLILPDELHEQDNTYVDDGNVYG